MTTIASIHAKLDRQRQPVHPLDGLEPAPLPSLADARNRLRQRHMLDTERPEQIEDRLRKLGYSDGTARNLAEIACAVARALREGRMVGTNWGE